jgi:small subunit ribosomal protein S17
MDAEKIRNLTDEELRHQEREMNDQLFKLKFQLNMGQTEENPWAAQGYRPGQDRCPRARSGGGEEMMAQAQAAGRRKELIGHVVSNRMNKTIVVQVVRQKAHPLYARVISKAKKFYAHDEKNEAHVGDVVRLEETRPLSKLKRWKLKEIVRKTALVPEVAGAEEQK